MEHTIDNTSWFDLLMRASDATTDEFTHEYIAGQLKLIEYLEDCLEAEFVK